MARFPQSIVSIIVRNVNANIMSAICKWLLDPKLIMRLTWRFVGVYDRLEVCMKATLYLYYSMCLDLSHHHSHVSLAGMKKADATPMAVGPICGEAQNSAGSLLSSIIL
jgi:hypothetical protein